MLVSLQRWTSMNQVAVFALLGDLLLHQIWIVLGFTLINTMLVSGQSLERPNSFHLLTR
jgi:hypothetical protein